ncbi:MAG: hypothetical protein JSR19_08720 [Proteobacteria bacterium]|nr:hypothetical protein [Pseudomonadota bacterium]HQR04156.1 LPS assembly lipoprotein LptE [Rhodocyclaceae bacterium]
MKAIAALLSLLLLAACGFHLRGSSDLPFDTLYIGLPESSDLRAQIARTIEASSKTRIVRTPQESQAILTVTSNTLVKNILSLNSAGRVREYELVQTFSFHVDNGKGGTFLPQSDIVIRRDMSYSDDQILSKEAEEVLLRRDMQNDLVQQLLRRLATIHPTAPATTAAH